MDKQKQGQRARLIVILVGTAIIIAIVPWLVSFLGFIKIDKKNIDLFTDMSMAAKKWTAAGYFGDFIRVFQSNQLMIGSGLIFALLEIGLIFGLAPARLFKASGNESNKGKWGPPVSGHGEYGSARWQTTKEMEKSTTVWDTRNPPVKGGIVLGVDLQKGIERYYLSSDDTHTLIIGATRSGKTRRTILPTIWALAKAGESMVLTDPKGELCLSTMEYLKANKYNVIIMNYREPEKSAFWNPNNKVIENLKLYKYSEAEQTAREIAESLVNSTQTRSTDSFWSETAKSVITSLIMLTCIEADSEKQKHLYGVNYLLGQLGRPDYDEEVPLTQLIDQLRIDHPARRAWYTAGIAGDKTRASIFANALTSIQLLADSKIGWITSKQDHDMKSVGQEKTAVFLVIPDERSIYNVLATIYVDQLYQTLIELANEHGGRIPRRVNFLLDEFGNMPKIPDFDKKLTVAGGRGMRFTLVVQGIDQIEKLYDKAYKTITGNCNTWIYLRTSDPKTAKEIEERVGKYTISTTSSGMSAQYGGASLKPSTSSNTNLTGRSLLLADELMRWTNEDGALVLRMGEQPARFPTPELSTLQASIDYEMGDQKQTAELLIRRNASLPVSKIKIPSVWQPSPVRFKSKFDFKIESDEDILEQDEDVEKEGEKDESKIVSSPAADVAIKAKEKEEIDEDDKFMIPPKSEEIPNKGAEDQETIDQARKALSAFKI